MVNKMEMYDADYKHMYLTLFGAITSALEAIEENNYGLAEELLKKGQVEAEEIYIETE